MDHFVVVVTGVRQRACSQHWIWFPALYSRPFSLLVFKFWLHLVPRAAHRLPLAAESKGWGVGFSFR